jgi:hypothetical protein
MFTEYRIKYKMSARSKIMFFFARIFGKMLVSYDTGTWPYPDNVCVAYRWLGQLWVARCEPVLTIGRGKPV